ncbi:hypothetical protein FSP39_015119 [Pinctada imbricata]|uniref:Uncharacterized protein n=1 Tax=Pinctada imbricata TaxID=66713 RepID=A0AA89CBW3_PINIB|nr:hypothetical protein FSP39_015119 [Pinctada imbricata]
MYKECSLCAQKKVPVVITDGNKEVNWKQWKSVKEKRTMKDKEEKEIVLTVKKDEYGTLNELVDLFEEQFPRYQRHMFNVINQYKHYKVLKENPGSTECFCHVDFAENYAGKMTSEIQSMHFGASKPQITIHTGFYTVGGKKDIVTFCGVSDSLQHDPSSIWAFLKPILRSIKQKHPHIDTIHFFSDGLTFQYRQKANFFLLSTEIFNEGFSKATWNFHEAGHGKGIPDGIGGTLKRSADLTIRQGKVDIMNAQQFIDAFTPSSTSIYLYKVDQSDIDTVGESLKNVNLKTVPGTMKLHQVITNVSCTIRFREVSCTPFATCVTNGRPKSVPVTHWSRRFICSTFEELEKECLSCDVADVVGHPRFIIDDALDVDDGAIEMFPEDVPDNQSRFPISVRADGDCLPASGSVYAYGHDKCPNELRARIVIELTLNKAYYLEEKNLRKGLSEFEPKTRNHVKKSFAMYSDGYIPGITLSDEIIETINEREVMDMSKPKSFMGIWQLCALSSVLKMPLFSVYPKLGNPVLRKDLHRLLLPREMGTCSETAYVLWTTTRNDMSFFVPNHFVPVLPIASLEDEYETVATVNKTTELNVKNDSDDQVLYEEESAECRLRAQESKRRSTDNLDDISKCKRVDETGQRRENRTKDKVDPKVESSENEMHYKNDENTESVMRVNGETEKEKKNNESEKNVESVVKVGETVYKKEKDGRLETKMRKEDSIESSNC